MRAAIFALKARRVGRGGLIHRNAEHNHARLQRHRLFGQVQQRLVVPGQGGGGGFESGCVTPPTPATFQPRSDHGRRPIQLCNIRKVARAGHGACAVGVAHLFVRCPVSTINHFDTIFSAHVQTILLDLATWDDREQRTFKQNKLRRHTQR